MNAYILITERPPELAPFSECVFKTIRTRFPTADLHFFCNGMSTEQLDKYQEHGERVGGVVWNCDKTTHARWISDILECEDEPYFLCDTDVIFYESVENWTTDQPLMGYLIPEFRCPFSKAVTRSRLHTSLLRIDPVKVRAMTKKFIEPDNEFATTIDLIEPVVTSLNGNRIFNDCCSLLYHAVGGQPITNRQKEAYFHFHFGTISDLVLPNIPNPEETRLERKFILEHPEKGKGLWRAQDKWFADNQFVTDGVNVITPITKGQAMLALEWNIQLCRGNLGAMSLNDLAHTYFHGIDDLIDTMKDGRPKMAKEQIIQLFHVALRLYNHPFYLTHQPELKPIIEQITNSYADSVAWEGHPKSHLRIMGDVLRICGDEFFIKVAQLCAANDPDGGWSHARKWSQSLKERDWLGQHDEEGNPV